MTAKRPEKMPAAVVERMLMAPYGTGIVYIREYNGPPPRNGWKHKPIVGPPSRPFAELQYVERLEREGYSAGWCCRPGEYITTWEPERRAARFPSDATILLDRITEHAGPRARCWDVYAWKDLQPLFVDLRRRGSTENLSAAQARWRDAALDIGVMPSSFRRVDWIGGSLIGYSIKGMSVIGGQTDSWVKYRKGKYEFGGPNPDDARDWLQFYSDYTGLKGADLIWVLFRDNAGGAMTFWNLEQSRDRGN